MGKYLLPCDCGQAVPVDVGQAGREVTCACGATIEVPPLRKLRHLPVAAAATERRSSTWNSRRGTVAALVVLAGTLAAWAIWSRLLEPTIEPFDAAVRGQVVDEGLEKLTPFAAWELWVARYRPLAETGFAVFEHPHSAQIEQFVSKQRFLQKVLLIAAAVLSGAAAITALWPHPVPRRS